MKPIHADNTTEIKLKVIKENVPGQTKRKTTFKEFSEIGLRMRYGAFLKKIPFFQVTEQDFFYATKSIDEFIMDYYKGNQEIMDDYLKNNEMPKTLKEDLPKVLEVYWDILVKVNQNKFCNYMVLDKPIPGFQDIDITNWSGFKVISPFNTEMEVYYNVLTVKGSPKRIDDFTKPLRSEL